LPVARRAGRETLLHRRRWQFRRGATRFKLETALDRVRQLIRLFELAKSG